MRVCLLTDETLDTFDPSAYLKRYEWDYVSVEPPVYEFVDALIQRNTVDVFLNLYEGDEKPNASGLDLILALETLGVPFTGTDSTHYDPTREEMQVTAQANGLSFASGFHASIIDDLTQADKLTYPLIVKHPNSFASTGLTKESRVSTRTELLAQFTRMKTEYGAARVEEFIEGRELSCLVVENANDASRPFAYPPAEVQFSAGETFLHENAKWFDWDVWVVPLQDDALTTRIQDTARRFFVAMNAVGYARVDMRVRPNGEIIILEINPNCGVLYGPEDRSHADLPIVWDTHGHDGFLERIFRAAVKRCEMRQKNI